MLYVHVQELLPGGPCPEYVYRFRTHGYLPFVDEDEVRQWWQYEASTFAPWPERAQHFAVTGWSGWSANNFGLKVGDTKPPNARELNKYAVQPILESQPAAAPEPSSERPRQRRLRQSKLV